MHFNSHFMKYLLLVGKEIFKCSKISCENIQTTNFPTESCKYLLNVLSGGSYMTRTPPLKALAWEGTTRQCLHREAGWEQLPRASEALTAPTGEERGPQPSPCPWSSSSPWGRGDTQQGENQPQAKWCITNKGASASVKGLETFRVGSDQLQLEHRGKTSKRMRA